MWEDPPEPREFWFGGLTRWAVHAAPGIELFREEQSVDWTIALSLPMFLAFGTDFDGMGESAQGRFRDAYLEDSGLAVALTIGLGFGLGR